VLSEDNRKRVEKLLPKFQECWAKLDPRGTGKIKATEVESLIRLVPEPFGVSYPDDAAHYQKSYRKVRAKADFLRMQQLGHTGGEITAEEKVNFTGVLSGIIAVWLNEVGEIKMKGVQEQVQLLAASFLITTRAKAWADRTRQHLFHKKVAKLNINIDLLPPNAHLLLNNEISPTSGARASVMAASTVKLPLPKDAKERKSKKKSKTPSLTASMFAMTSFGVAMKKVAPDSPSPTPSPPSSSSSPPDKVQVVRSSVTSSASRRPDPMEEAAAASNTSSSPTTTTVNKAGISEEGSINNYPIPASQALDLSSIKPSSSSSGGGTSSSREKGQFSTPPLTPNRPHGTPPRDQIPPSMLHKASSSDGSLNNNSTKDSSTNAGREMLDRPSSPSPPRATSQAPGEKVSDSQNASSESSSNRRTSGEKLNNLRHTNGKKSKSISGAASLYNEDNLPAGWVMKVSKLYHTQFYFHAETSTSSWYHPLDPRFIEGKSRNNP
jgi:hypothetical protein